MNGKIKQFFLEVGVGVGRAMVISPDRPYVDPKNNSFKVDSINLRGDVKKIGNDLKKKLKQKYSHDESSYQR